MASYKEIISSEKLEGGAAVKEGCRILATTVLSLLQPISLLLLARLSVARYFLSVHSNEKVPFLISLLLQSKTTTIFSLLVSAVAIAALIQGLTGFDGTILVGADMHIFSVGNLVFPRRLVLVLGLHEMMVFWLRNVVKPVVDEAVLGFSDEGFSWVEKAVLAVALGFLWWRRLRADAEALVVLPRIRVELKMDVEVADDVGWWLYYLTAAIGGVKVIKGFLWAVNVLANQFHSHLTRINPVQTNQLGVALV
ncbi:hypothetical protein C2S52_017436 [Perilla frutescens var. hirtella]|nr:hypothetical protein C2S52_017436 [Perilla frutescens var. hirtella]